jgi:hypothetical protein
MSRTPQVLAIRPMWRIGLIRPLLPISLLLWLAATILAAGAETLKVICAARTASPPVIDGRLDDECWTHAEERTDFVAVASGAAVARPTSMRLLFDASHVYLGIECQWDDIGILERAATGIRASAKTAPGEITPFPEYANQYGVELFIDPGASERNYYQILCNAAGQFTGNYKGLWPEFHGGQTVKSAVYGNLWCLEIAYPYAGINAGDEWGLNVCRNDETYYSIWKRISGSYHEPKLFGRIVMGDYAEWWNAVWGGGVKARLAAAEKDVPRLAQRLPYVQELQATVLHRMETVEAEASSGVPAARDEFERLYLAYHDFLKDFRRFVSAYDAAALMEKAR